MTDDLAAGELPFDAELADYLFTFEVLEHYRVKYPDP